MVTIPGKKGKGLQLRNKHFVIEMDKDDPSQLVRLERDLEDLKKLVHYNKYDSKELTF
jgi:hypothetical protein